ncbi:biopolymer transporter ExbD [Mucilaginibacter sp. HMF5004]|uniref:ExbD/TolR family protein n=1 Tax=Mucilaginibacter rivuli TaxID=2857527 RepID=UPI001C5F4307|nr:biopolymer transporter ExbD [Mucilaginibacter rivuli]MBW4890504.1 biopolymer transporter ExbD [Mucilaginibacter rivuli]
MAELDTSGGGKHKGGKVRSKKASTRVDLTAMVDLAFLLITFFMLTTTLSKSKAMDMVMPDKDDQKKDELAVAESRTMTILLGSHDKIEWYMGLPGKSTPTIDNFGKDGLRKALIENGNKVKAEHGGQPMIVLIKPSDKSNYANFVAALDELNITGIDIHAVVDIMPIEVEDLKKNGLY